MKHISRKTLIIILSSLILINILILFVTYRNIRLISQPALPSQPAQYVFSLNKYTDSIHQFGPAAAYTKFRHENDKITNVVEQHIQAHLFGEALYKTTGIDGVNVCDGAYTYGCYHSFFSFAIQEHGLEVVSDLRTACERKNKTNTQNCIHGIGHSIVYYLGDDHLSEALDECSKIATGDFFKHCTNGAFMEYNMHTTSNPAGEKKYVRKFSNDYYQPCNTVATKYQASCFHQLPQWWTIILSGTDMQKRIGELCYGITNVSYAAECYYAYGEIMTGSQAATPQNAIASCQEFPEQVGVMTCEKGFFESGKHDPDIKQYFTPRICTDLKPEEQKQCEMVLNS